MKNRNLVIVLAVSVCTVSSLFGFGPLSSTAANHSKVNISHTLQSKVQPFCKFTFVDHRGHSTKLSTSVCHASSRSLTFIFDSGEKLIINFTMIRAGHFVAESHRSKDPQILFYTPGGSVVPLVGAVLIASTKPITGNFSHLMSDDDDHLTLVSGSFSL